MFSTYNANHNKESVSIIFPIKEILIENNVAINLLEFKSDLDFLINTNLFLLNKNLFLAVINKYDFISSIQLKKNTQIP